MIDAQYASLTSQGVQHRVFYLDGHPSRYQPRPTGLNFGEQTGTGVFPMVIAVPHKEKTLEVKLRSTETQSTYNICSKVKGVIDVHYASLPFPGKASAEHSFIAFEGTNDSCQRSNVLFSQVLQLSLVTFSEMRKEPT